MAYGIFRAPNGFVFADEDGGLTHVRAGALAREGHSIMKGREHLFVPLEIDYDTDGEPARRGPGRPRKTLE